MLPQEATSTSLAEMTPELHHVLLLSILFILPKALQKFGLPSAITSFALGALCAFGHHAVNLFRDNPIAQGPFVGDPTVKALGTFGIVALFLYAGLEIDVDELKKGARTIATHLVLRLMVLSGVSFALVKLIGLPVRPALVIALALLTPSTGFIIESINTLPLSDDEKYWIKTKAISSELVALFVLFFVLNSDSPVRLGLSTLALVAMIMLLPVAFRLFARYVAPHAPKSEFAFLVMIAVVCAYITKSLGVYYLVGAFVVGLAAQWCQRELPAIASHNMLHAIDLFASFFIPFYFFKAGLSLQASDFSFKAVLVGALFLIAVIPLRLLIILIQRRIANQELAQRSLRIAIPMLPTLVFTLVLSSILREQYESQIDAFLFGGLLIYTLVNTIVPGFVMRGAATDYERDSLRLSTIPQAAPATVHPDNAAPDTSSPMVK